MSAQAEHLCALRIGVADLVERPSRHPDYLARLDHAQWRLRAWAEFVIGWGC